MIEPYFERDGITIFHANCRDILPSLSPGDVDLVLTDPPYGISLDTANHHRKRGALAKANDYTPVAEDDRPFDPLPLLKFRRLILFGANHFAERLPPSPSWLVWDKTAGLQSKRAIGFNDNADGELIWTNLGGPVRILGHQWIGLMKATERQEPRMHPTQKPVALVRWLVEHYTRPGDLVFDPYMGSGPIAEACQQTGRRYIGSDTVESYCAAAVRRLAQQVLPLAS